MPQPNKSLYEATIYHLSLVSTRRLKTIKGDEMNRSEKRSKATKSDVLRHHVKPFGEF